MLTEMHIPVEEFTPYRSNREIELVVSTLTQDWLRNVVKLDCRMQKLLAHC